MIKMVKELEKLNPNAKFTHNDPGYVVHIIYGNIPADKLNLPNGYEYNSKNGITNKHHSDSGLYETFKYEQDTERFIARPQIQHQPQQKKSLFARIFGF